MSDVRVTKDKKGACYFVSHKRCGFTDGTYFTLDELRELKELLEEIV